MTTFVSELRVPNRERSVQSTAGSTTTVLCPRRTYDVSLRTAGPGLVDLAGNRHLWMIESHQCQTWWCTMVNEQHQASAPDRFRGWTAAAMEGLSP